MWVFTTKEFSRFARRERIDDAALCDAIARAEHGLVAADLGGGLIKQRVARPGQGRSCGFRTIIVYSQGDRSVFVYGFAKNEQDNVGAADLSRLKRLAAVYFDATPEHLQHWCEEGELKEIECDA